VGIVFVWLYRKRTHRKTPANSSSNPNLVVKFSTSNMFHFCFDFVGKKLAGTEYHRATEAFGTNLSLRCAPRKRSTLKTNWDFSVVRVKN
jgi:hypothetical protein